jgi:GABA(A) receptor-associated protein
MSFKTNFTLEERFNESYKMLQKYPDRVPVICEKNQKSKKTYDIDKTKYLVPNDLTISQFIYVIRKRLSLKSEEAVFIIVNGFMPPSSCYMSDIYELYKDMDGFVYFTYSFENVFG